MRLIVGCNQLVHLMQLPFVLPKRSTSLQGGIYIHSHYNNQVIVDVMWQMQKGKTLRCQVSHEVENQVEVNIGRKSKKETINGTIKT
mgnify:CR=1 FL=1